MQAASGRKSEYCRRRARRASALMVVLALLFTMVPTGFATVAGATEATETAPSEPPAAPPEPTPEPPADDTTDDPAEYISDDPADDITDRAAPTATAVAVICYAAVDGGWQQVGTVQTDKIDSDSTRYYIMAQELDGIYGVYGFCRRIIVASCSSRTPMIKTPIRFGRMPPPNKIQTAHGGFP